MKKIIIQKLIVISQSEKISRELSFNDNFNVVIGGNKTGKSSIIKSIFHTLGCKVKFEESWKRLIDYYILYFKYDDEFCLLRQEDSYKLINCTTNSVLIDTKKHNDFSEALMSVFGVEMECVHTQTGKVLPPTVPLIFRFQYIDQDSGWTKIGESFSSLQYIKDWKANTNKYVVGFVDNSYYQQKRKIDEKKVELKDINTKKENYGEFISSLESHIKSPVLRNDDGFSVMSIKSETKKIIGEIEDLEREQIKENESLEKLKNVSYKLNLEIQYIKSAIDESNKDYAFAMNESEKIVCPFCGTESTNTIEDRLNIATDIYQGNEMLSILRQDVQENEQRISEHKNRLMDLRKLAVSKKNQIKKYEENYEFLEEVKAEGKNELFKTANKERNLLKTKHLDESNRLTLMQKKLTEMKSKKVANGIRKELKSQLEITYEALNLNTKEIKLRDFVQVLDKTGSDSPRVVFAYHSALYLYNIARESELFNFLIVDTPNQQGQDDVNLENINSMLDILRKSSGQIILGTERETGYEEMENVNVIRLLEKRKCLSDLQYEEHSSLVEKLDVL